MRRKNDLLYPFLLCLGLISGGWLMGVAAQLPQKAQEEEPLRIATDLVLLNVTVTDASGNYAGGLKEDDFLLFDEGKPVHLEHFSTELTPFAAAILIDASGSMEGKLSRARVAAAHFQDRTRPSDVVCIYSFNSKVECLQEFTPGRDVSPRLWNLEAEGMTKAYDCLEASLTELGKREEKRRAVVLISDGEDTQSRTSAKKVIQLALQTDTTVYSVDLIDPAKVALNPAQMQAVGFLKEISEKSGGRYLKSPGGTQLDTKFEEIVNELRQQYTLGFYAPEGQKTGQFRKLEVKLKRSGFTCRTRQGYIVTQ